MALKHLYLKACLQENQIKINFFFYLTVIIY